MYRIRLETLKDSKTLGVDAFPWKTTEHALNLQSAETTEAVVRVILQTGHFKTALCHYLYAVENTFSISDFLLASTNREAFPPLPSYLIRHTSFIPRGIRTLWIGLYSIDILYTRHKIKKKKGFIYSRIFARDFFSSNARSWRARTDQMNSLNIETKTQIVKLMDADDS